MLCKLCGEAKDLQLSHIIPKSYFSDLKRKSGQLVTVTCDSDTPSTKSNCDPKEKLFCLGCEDFLNVNFEQYGTRLFKSSFGVKKNRAYIEFNGFKYTEYYLYLVSILWRASIASISEFSSVKLLDDLDALLARCIKAKSIKISTSLKLDHFIKISIFRIVDSKNNIDDHIIKNVIMGFNSEFGLTPSDGLVYYFMVNGFFIMYHMKPESNIHHIRTAKIYGQIENRSSIKIPKVEISEVKQIYNAFKFASEKASSEFKKN